MAPAAGQGRVRGLGLAWSPRALPGLDPGLAAPLRAGLARGALALAQTLDPAAYVRLFAAWAVSRGLRRVALTPYGSFARAVAAAAPEGLALEFFDQNVQPPARSRDELRPVEHPLVAVTSPAFGQDIRLALLEAGFADEAVVTVDAMLDELLAGQEQDTAAAVRDAAASLAGEGKALAAWTWGRAGSALLRQVEEGGPRAIWRADHCFADSSQGRDVHPGQLPGRLEEPSACLALAPPAVAREAYRELVLENRYAGSLVLPFAPAGDFPATGYSDGSPAVFWSPPFAGTGRFAPAIVHLARCAGRDLRILREPNANSRLIAGMSRDGDIPREARSAFLRGAALGLGYYESILVHYFYDLRCLADLEGLRTLALLRDPRDMLNSQVFAALGGRGADGYEALALESLAGRQYDASPGRLFRWPALGELLDMYLAVAECPRMAFLRFEDLHADSAAAYRAALAWLGWSPDPLGEPTDRDLAQAIRLGSFEYQTRGQRRRGEENPDRVLGGSCRKGVTGDWRNHFTPRLKDRFKALAGDALARLGYEPDDTW